MCEHGHRLSACPGPFADIRESRVQNHCVNRSNESRMTDCIGILCVHSDSEIMDLAGILILAPPVLYAGTMQYMYRVLRSSPRRVLDHRYGSNSELTVGTWKPRLPSGTAAVYTELPWLRGPNGRLVIVSEGLCGDGDGNTGAVA
jgi:hypothetical protein